MNKRTTAKVSLVAIGAIAISVTAIIAGCIEVEEPKLTTITLGYQPSTHHVAAMVAVEKGWLKEDLARLGIEYVDIKVFPTGPPMMTAMMAGELDIAYVGLAPPVAALYRGLDARVVAAVNNEGSALVIRPELVEEYEKVGLPAVLAGKRVATFPPGSIQHTVLTRWLREHGMCPVADMDMKAMGPAPARTAIAADEVDAVFLPSPSPAMLEIAGDGVIVLWSEDIMPGFICCGIVASGRMIREHPEIVKQIIRTHINATRWVEENPAEAAEIFVKTVGGDVATVKRSFEIWDGSFIVDPHLGVESALIYADVIFEINREEFEAHGIEPLTKEDIFDTSFYDAIRIG